MNENKLMYECTFKPKLNPFTSKRLKEKGDFYTRNINWMKKREDAKK